MAKLRCSSWVLDAVGAGPELGAPHAGQGEDSALTECGAAELRAVRVQGWVVAGPPSGHVAPRAHFSTGHGEVGLVMLRKDMATRDVLCGLGQSLPLSGLQLPRALFLLLRGGLEPSLSSCVAVCWTPAPPPHRMTITQVLGRAGAEARPLGQAAQEWAGHDDPLLPLCSQTAPTPGGPPSSVLPCASAI